MSTYNFHLLVNQHGERFIFYKSSNGEKIIATRNREAQRLKTVLNEDSEQAITDAKYGFISGALKETFVDNHLEQEQTTRVIDAIVTHRIWGYPIFFLFLYLMFQGTFVLGEYRLEVFCVLRSHLLLDPVWHRGLPETEERLLEVLIASVVEETERTSS